MVVCVEPSGASSARRAGVEGTGAKGNVAEAKLWPATTRQVSVAYRIDINEYQGKQSVQLVVEFVEPVLANK